jgi:alpha-beta hydrolase superfamily lysophospholipase
LLLIAPAVSQQPDYVSLAKQYARLVQTGQYEQARAMFDATMTRMVTAQKLQQSWDVMVQTHGPFQKFGQPTLQKIEQYQVVLIPTEFQRYRVAMKVVFTQPGQITGYFWVPFTASKPPPYLETKVREQKVTVGPWKLPGLLTLPAGPVKAGVVLVHGSGPNDMDEKIGPNKPFRDLAKGLAAQGIATLRYDKRTNAHGLVMSVQHVTLNDEVIEDALAAVKQLRAVPSLKGKPIVLLGHSLGAIVGPEMARRDGKLQGLILMGGPARPFTDALIDQLNYLASLGGPDARAETDKVITAIRNLNTLPDNDRTIIGAPAYYWREVAEFQSKSIATARELKCKVLIMQGGRDYQGTTEDLQIWQAGLKDRPNVTCKLFPNLNHLFAPGEGKSTPQEYLEQNYMDPKVMQTIGSWVSKL